jgi:type VI secretion system protein ImpJ
MLLSNKVLWQEGMFIHPQHFQQQDRYVEQLLINHCETLVGYFWGFNDYQLDEKLLQTGRLAISQGSGVMPDGAFFQMPAQDVCPIPLVVPVGVKEQLVYLALPLSQLGMTNVTTEQASAVRYLATDQEVLNSTMTGSNAVNIPVGQLNFQLKLEDQDLRQFSSMPIAKIREVTSEGRVVLDEQFIPPCLDLSAATRLMDYLREVNSLVTHRAEILAKRMGDINRSNSAVADFLMLQLLNRFEPVLNFMQKKARLHPEMLYQSLLQLFGELATFTNTNKRPSELTSYNHNQLQQTFQPVMSAIRYALSRVMEQVAFELPLEKQAFGLLAAALADRLLLNNSTFVLAVTATVPAETLLTRLPAQIKIGAADHIQQLIRSQLPGVKLKALPSAPPQIPYNTGYSYFKLDFSKQELQQLSQSGSMALHVAGDFPDLKLELWVIREV